MRTFLGTVLSAIAVGVMLIAYGLLTSNARAAGPIWSGAPVTADSRSEAAFGLRCEPGQRAIIRQVAGAAEAGCVDPPSFDRYGSVATPVAYRTSESRQFQTYDRAAAPRRISTVRVERKSGRDWKKTALVIGGSAGAGAGLGAIIGGKKGALIGAAIGAGGGTVYEMRKK